MRLIRYISCFVTILFVSQSYGQSLTGQALEFYKVSDFKNAMVWIDSAITTNERFDSQTWQLRGLIYRSTCEGDQFNFCDIALESLIHSKEIDQEGIYTQKIDNYIKNVLIRYFNKSVVLLKENGSLDKSEEMYLDYKAKYLKLLDNKHDFKSSDIEYYNALGAEYLSRINKSEPSKREMVRVKAIENFGKVIQIDSLDYQSNFNSGIVYYNYGADFVMNQDPFLPIEDFISNQGKMETAFLKALPFLRRAERIKPNSKEVIEALTGCFWGLNNDEMYAKYQKMADQLNINDYIEQHKKDPGNVEILKQLIRVYSTTLIDETKKDYYQGLLNDLKN